MDAGHYKGRGIGGGSGTYFDERNIHLQCKRCNGFHNGRMEEHAEYIEKKYDHKTLKEIERKSKLPLNVNFGAIEIYFTERCKELERE
jgi:hypothetical protein